MASWRQAIPNGISLARLAAGLCYPLLPAEWRLPAIGLALASDLLDGAASRLLHGDSALGRLLDPIADKVFVLAVIGTLFVEEAIGVVETLLVATRDMLVTAGAAWVVLRSGWDATARMRARLAGKLTTGLQFLFFAGVCWQVDWLRWTAAPLACAAGIGAAWDYLVAVEQRADPSYPDVQATRKRG